MAVQLSCQMDCNISGKEELGMSNPRLFSRADVLRINQRTIMREAAPLASEISNKILREVRFSREQINSAFAAARRQVAKA
jgi:hypothetical protein